MKCVFVDTAFYIGFLRRSDALHARCVEFDRGNTAAYLTSEFVLTELGNWLAGTSQRGAFAEFVRRLRTDRRTTIIPADTGWFERGMRLYADRGDKQWSLTDCLSFEIMRDRRLTDALTADRHFEQAGFRALMAEGEA